MTNFLQLDQGLAGVVQSIAIPMPERHPVVATKQNTRGPKSAGDERFIRAVPL